MKHLDDAEFVELLDGHLPALRVAHLKVCAKCSARASEMRAAADEARALPVPEPSPLFWEHLSSRIDQALERQPAPRGTFHPFRVATWTWSAAGVLAVVGIAAVLWRTPHPNGRPLTEVSIAGDAARVSRPDGRDIGWIEDADADEAWALVRTVADDIDWDEANAADIALRPEAAERAIPELSAEERTELQRVLEQELHRNGA
jgi:hypothetical protein